MAQRNSIWLLLAVSVAMLATTGCTGSQIGEDSALPATRTTSAVETPTDPVEPPTDPVESETQDTEPTFTELKFGETLAVRETEGEGTSEVTLGKPHLAKCQYQYLECDDPQVGDRVVSVPITIENTGSTTTEWGEDYFVLEFPDGTQMSTSDGSALDYTPDNAMDYVQKVRPNSKYKSVLVFEAPDGPFSVLILTNDYDGEPFAGWS